MVHKIAAIPPKLRPFTKNNAPARNEHPQLMETSGRQRVKAAGVSPTFAVGWPNRDFKNIFPA